MLTEKDYCDLESTKALESLGMNVYTSFCGKDVLKHVLLYEAQKWLREKKNIQIEIPISFMDNGVWKFSFRIQTPEFYDRALGEWDSFEEALLEGIKEAIRILKDGINGN